MEIKTKFEVYDKVFFIHNKKVCDSVVKGIKVEVSSSPIEISTSVTYLCNKEPDHKMLVCIKVEEEDAFKSKEELLKSL